MREWRTKLPAGIGNILQTEDVALAKLRAAKIGVGAIEVARDFGVRCLSATARARIEAA